MILRQQFVEGTLLKLDLAADRVPQPLRPQPRRQRADRPPFVLRSIAKERSLIHRQNSHVARPTRPYRTLNPDMQQKFSCFCNN